MSERPIDGMSATSINTFMSCARKFQYRYTFHMQEEPQVYFVLGKATHSTIQAVYTAFVYGIVSNVESVFRVQFQKANEDNSITDLEALAKAESEGLTMVKAYPFDNPPDLMEFHFEVEIAGQLFHGYMDQVFYPTDENPAIIVDLKTSRSMPNKYYVENDYQFGLYALAYYKIFGTVPIVQYYHLRSGRTYNVQYTKERLALIESDIEQVLRMVQFAEETNTYPKSPSFLCSACSYKEMCLG